MNVLVSGSSGLIGRALVASLTAEGHRVIRLVRSKPLAGQAQVFWDIEAETVDKAALENLDAVVHLAGESVAGRWTAGKKLRIRESRRKGTRLLSEALAAVANRPRVFVSASAVGYYGDRGKDILSEESPPGTLFLSEVCREWEAATEPAAHSGIRIVNLRIGFVLSPEGGGLAQMLPPFKLGVGGTIGSGRQYMSWVSIHDVVGAVRHVLASNTLDGPVNAVAPNPVTNREFTKTLGRVLKRPTLFPVPAFAARLLLGEMADNLLLASACVLPTRLMASGYQFRARDLQGALQQLLLKAV